MKNMSKYILRTMKLLCTCPSCHTHYHHNHQRGLFNI